MSRKKCYRRFFRYQRDPIGNRTSSVSSENGSPITRDYITNDLNQYTAITNPSTSPTYDDDGNCTSTGLESGEWIFTWNAENRLIKAVRETTELEYKYDYMGRMISRKHSEGGALISHEYFVYDGYKKIETLDALNSNSVIKKNLWSGEMMLSETHGATRYYAFADANKNIVQYVDAAGFIQEHREYKTFGGDYSATGPMAGQFEYGFSSEYKDPTTGLVMYIFRAYDPETGRFISRDPIEEQGGKNLYGMADNSPINYIDLLGLADASFYKEGAEASLEAYKKTIEDVPKSEPNTINIIVTAPEYGGRICCKNGVYKRTPPEKTSKWVITKGEFAQGRTTKYYDSVPKDPRMAEITKSPAIIPASLKTCEEVFGSDWKSVAIYHSHPHQPNFSKDDITLTSRPIIFMGHKEKVKVAEPKEVHYDEMIDGRRISGKRHKLKSAR